MTKLVTVYGLRSSEDGLLRYVGQTSQTLRQRFNSHMNKAVNGLLKGHLSSWINHVLATGHKVEFFEIEANAERNAAEIRWIALHRGQGACLVNMTDGGEGGLGSKRKPMSEESKAKIRAAKVGKKLSAEHRAAIGEAQKNRQFSDEHRARISAGKLGHTVTENTRRKLSDALRGTKNSAVADRNRTLFAGKPGHKHTDEAKAKMSASAKGRKMSPEWIANMLYGQRIYFDARKHGETS